MIRRLDGVLHGDYRTLFRGYGLDLADLREYVYHDDVRHIDWNVTARLQTPYVREYNEEREVAAWFLLDLSPSVAFGSQKIEKRAVAAEFVAVLARILTAHGNRVGAMFYGNHIERVVPARAGRNQVLSLIKDLLSQPIFNPGGMTDVTPMLVTALNMIKRRSLVFVISDFISQPGWERPLSLLNRRHEVLAIRLTDPSETKLPDIGPVIMQDAETGEQLYVDTHDARFRKRFEQAALLREQQLHESFKRAGVDELPLSTTDDLIAAIIRFAALRQQRRR